MKYVSVITPETDGSTIVLEPSEPMALAVPRLSPGVTVAVANRGSVPAQLGARAARQTGRALAPRPPHSGMLQTVRPGRVHILRWVRDNNSSAVSGVEVEYATAYSVLVRAISRRLV
jgi:hypothetical protein